jgi:hypothetical protein
MLPACQFRLPAPRLAAVLTARTCPTFPGIVAGKSVAPAVSGSSPSRAGRRIGLAVALGLPPHWASGRGDRRSRCAAGGCWLSHTADGVTKKPRPSGRGYPAGVEFNRDWSVDQRFTSKPLTGAIASSRCLSAGTCTAACATEVRWASSTADKLCTRWRPPETRCGCPRRPR